MGGGIGGLGTPSYTVKEPVELVGEPYFAGQPDRIIVHPSERSNGVWFTHDYARGARVPLKMTTLHAVQEWSARFLQLHNVEGADRVRKVVEHTLAALFGALGPDVSAIIEVPSSKKHVWLPVLGPGIQQPFNALYDAKTPVSGTLPRYPYVGLRCNTQRYEGVGGEYLIECDGNSVTYSENVPHVAGDEPDLGYTRVMKFSISDTPQITVHSSIQPKGSVVAALQTQPYTTLYAPDALHDNQELLAARPLARLGNTITYGLFKILQPIFTFQGLSEKNYIMVTPHDTTPSSVIDKMQPSFRDDQNEWFAHTTLDILAEIGIIPRAVYAQHLGLSVEVWNSNHLFRMRAIQRLFEKDYFGPRIPQSDPTV